MLNSTLQVGDRSYELAPTHLIESLFTTISYRLEPDGRATRFPLTMLDLYDGRLDARRADAALQELATIERELKSLPPSRAVSNFIELAPFDDANQPVNHGAANLFDYFVAADRRPLLSVFRDAVSEAKQRGAALELESEPEPTSLKDKLVSALGFLFLVATGGGLTAHSWYTLTHGNYYYPKLAFIGPVVLFLGLVTGLAGLFGATNATRALAGGARARGGRIGAGFSRGQKILLWVLGILAVLAGVINIYLIETYTG